MSAKKLTDGSPIMTKDFVVMNKLGIHARPAAMFVKTANRFSCDIFVEKDGEKVNGKSIMGLMMLAAGPGSTLTAHAFPLINVTRPDEIRPCLTNEEALRNAPASANGLFMVPKIVE